jgi:hypothetical protein
MSLLIVPRIAAVRGGGVTYLKTLSSGYQGFLWVPTLHLLLPQLSRIKVMIRALFMRFFAL